MDAPFPNMDAARAGAEGVLWPQPVDFFSDLDIAPPMLRREHIPDGLWSFVSDTSERMGVDPTGVALGCLVSSATVISEDWKIQPKRHDYTWTENARLWGAILGDPSILKTPLIRECSRPIDKLEAEARKTHQEDMKLYKAELAVWKKSDMSTPEPVPPAMSRYMIEGATIEAISEVLRDDGRFCAPSGKCSRDKAKWASSSPTWTDTPPAERAAATEVPI